MKRSTFAAVAAVFVGSLIGCGSVAQAQEQKPQAPEAKTNAPVVRTTRFDRTDYWARRLNLSAEQKEQIRPIMEEETKKIDELRLAKDMKPQDRTAKAKEIREATTAKLKPILTEAQWEQYTKPFQGRVQTAPRTNAVPGSQPAPQPAK